MESSTTAGVVVSNLTAKPLREKAARVLTMPYQTAALLLLLIGVSVEQPAFEVAGLTVKPEHLALAILWALSGWRLLTSGRLKQARLLYWTLPFIATLLAALLNAPDPPASLRNTLMIALVASAACLTFGLVDTGRRLALAVDFLVGLACAESVLILAALAAASYFVPLGTQAGRGGIPVPNGTLWEPNLLGSYLAAGALLALTALIAARPGRRPAVLAFCLCLILTALGLSLARAAWLGFAAGVSVLVVGYVVLRATRRQRVGVATRNVVLALLAVALTFLFLVGIAPIVFPGTSAGLLSRVNLSTYDPQIDPSLRARLDTFHEALPGIQAHPLLGNGAGSFAVGHQDAKGNPGWLANLELHLLYDSGILGLACWLVGIGGLVWAAWRTLTRLDLQAPESPALQWTILGLLGSLASLLVAFQATEGSWLAFPWVYLGLLACAGSLRSRLTTPINE